jgi:triacylglycerol lipase
MTTLSPERAAAIATGVYRLREFSIPQAAHEGQLLGCEDAFALKDSSRFTATSGELLFKELSGFGYIAEGKGAYQGEVLIATRGTDTFPDLLTDANIGLQPGPSGRSVHAGFNKVWKFYAPEIRAFLRNRNPTVVHCVGHSLGGALAHLNAEMLSVAGVAQIKLYTFGSPRVGLWPFVDNITDGVGAAHMYRVYNGADVVAMVPVFPFFHTPGYLLRNGQGGLIRDSAHFMKHYSAGVAGMTWDGIAAFPEPKVPDDQLDSWLTQTAAIDGPAVFGSAYTLRLISRAIHWILEAAGYGVVVGISAGFTASFTLLDRLAWLLHRSAQVSKVMAERVGNLIAVIFKFLGRQMVEGANLTIAFISWVLNMLLTALRAVVHRALFKAQL